MTLNLSGSRSRPLQTSLPRGVTSLPRGVTSLPGGVTSLPGGVTSLPFTPQHTSTMPKFHVGSEENLVQPEHWVSRLFPPTYREEEDDQEMRTVLGDRLTALDPDALRKVFHRVHALLTTQRDAGEGPAAKPGAETASAVAPPAPGTDESCIWDEAELSDLRQNYKSTRDENRKLKTHLKFAEQRLASLDHKYTKLQRGHDQNTRDLSEAKQANSRLHILSQTLKQDLDNTTKINKDLETEVQNLKLERLDFIDKLKQSRLESDHDRMEKKRLELTVRENGRTLLETASHLESKLRVKYEREVSAISRRVEELEQELAEERQTHQATRRGLDHLRTHFSSLPIEGGLGKDGLADLKAY